MNIKSAIAVLSAAVTLLAMSGCGDKNESVRPYDVASDASSSSSETASENVSAEGEKLTTKDGLFSVVRNPRFTDYEGVFSKQYEFFIEDKAENINVGVMEVADMHISAECFTEAMKQQYEASYEDIKSYAAENSERPAYILEAVYSNEDGSKRNFYFEAVQYGNGDNIVVLVSSPLESAEKGKEAAEEILATAEYYGDAEKTEPETHTNDFFSITADKDNYFYSADDKEATVRPNIANNDAERYGSFKLSAEKSGSTAQELASADEQKSMENEKIGNVSVSETNFLGNKAVCVSCILMSDVMNLKREVYYFDFNGVCYQAQYLAPENGFDEYKESAKALVDTIELK